MSGIRTALAIALSAFILTACAGGGSQLPVPSKASQQKSGGSTRLTPQCSYNNSSAASLRRERPLMVNCCILGVDPGCDVPTPPPETTCAFDCGSGEPGGSGGGTHCPPGEVLNGVTGECDSNDVSDAPGKPMAGETCGANDSAVSIQVGATVGYANINGQEQARSVVDINTIDAFSGTNIVNGQTMYVNVRTIGWVYEDNNGAYWFQQDTNTDWTYSFGAGVTVGSIVGASFGINSPPGSSAVSIGSTPGRLENNVVATPCWQNGAKFYAGEVG